MGVNGIYGLSGSGIDVESMVKVGMMTKQTEYDKMYKKSITETWQKEAYSTIYTDLNNFKATVADFNKQSTMNAMKASSTATSSVTATANGAASAMNHTVSVSQTASDAYLLSKNAIVRSNTSASSSIYLKDVMGITTKTENGTTTYGTTAAYSASQVTITDSSSGTTYDASKLTIDSDGTYKLDGNTVDSSKLSYTVTNTDGTTSTFSATDMNVSSSTTDGTTTYTFNGTTYHSASDTALSFTIKDTTTADTTAAQIASHTISYTYADLAGNKTLNDLSSSINKLGLNITAGYDATNDAFSLYNKSGGTANTISITAGDTGAKTLLDNLQLASSDGTTLGSVKTFTVGTEDDTAGKNASVTIDGKEYTGLSSNTMTVSGVTYTFLGKTDTAATVSVSQDTDSIVSSVKSFVTAYNAMIDEMNSKIYETKYSDYEPLTKTQESSMTTQQVTDWNAKAKSGILYNSSMLKTIVSNMREAIYTPVDSVESNYNSASAIGISSSTNKGHLTLDEDKLKTALAADPDCVYQIFGSLQDSDKTDSVSQKSDYSNTGIANRLYFNVTTEGLSTLKSYAGTSSEKDDSSYLGTLITNLQNKMSDFKVQMSSYEDLLYKKYDAMETAIATLSSQLSSVTGSSS